jgi:hypothetical protein
MFRPFFLVLLLVVGCAGGSQPSDDDSSAEQRVGFTPEIVCVTELYSDAEIQKKTKYDINKESIAAGWVLQIPYLDDDLDIPNKNVFTRREVMRSLALDDSRLHGFKFSPSSWVMFLRWHVSPSYDLFMMTAKNVPGEQHWEYTDEWVARFSDLDREVYGIRFVKRDRH